MTLEALLSELAARRVRLSVDGEDLRLKAPRGAITPELRDALKVWKPSLIERLSGRQAAAAGEAPILPVPRDGDGLPLSFAQQRLWFLDRLDPGGATYNLPEGYRIRGELDVEALRESVREVVRRHEALRTRFEYRDWRALQRFDATGDFDVPLVHIEGATPEARELELRRRMQEEAVHAFDLQTGPLARVSILVLGDEDHVLLRNVHHIVYDSWSNGVFLDEVGRIYEGLVAGMPVDLPEPAVQFADVAAHEQRTLDEAALAPRLAYWRDRLGDGDGVLALPTDHPRPAMQSYRGARLDYALPAALVEGLRALARERGATMYMLLLSALQMLLSRWTGQEDIRIGSPIHGRDRPELQEIIGFFANTLVMRGDLSGDPSFTEVCRRAREVTAGAYSNADVPFQQLVDALQPERDPSRPPLFQVMLSFAEAYVAETPSLHLEDIPLRTGSAKFDLTVELFDLGDAGIRGCFEYATDLFEASTVVRLGEQLREVLEEVVAAPGTRLSQLRVLPSSERSRLLGEWNATQVTFEASPVHALVSSQASRTPESVAVECGGSRLSYAELESASNRLAHHLLRAGIGAGTRVGVCLPRSQRMVVGLLGVLKTGAAYVPLDPSFPAERLSYMASDAGLSLLLTESSVAAVLDGVDVARMELDALDEVLCSHPASSPAVSVTGSTLAYVLYTSGSTGRPKGVCIGHGALSNFLQSMAREPGLSARDVLVAVTTLSFDIAGLELYLPLVVGARVVVASTSQVSDGEALAALLARTGASVMQATPATWRMLLASGWRAGPGMKVLCGGEAFPREVAQSLLSGGAEVWNLYGPTETTIWSSVHRVSAGEGEVPVGHPIANTQLHVVDRHGALAPVGAVGELYIGGAGLAQGYLGRPELDAERFVPSPFGEGGRLYRTGDLARRRGDGVLEVHGRIDAQVKLRGFRIELGEVEWALSRHGSVAAAVCAVQTVGAGDERLVAYVVAAAPATVEGEELRGYLRESLPEYMVPVSYEVLESLPLTPNGKVDRQALPALQGAPAAAPTSMAPRTPTETALVAVWEAVLGVPGVGVRDDFFDLGGHSLLAVRLVAEVRERLSVPLTLASVFHERTVERLARSIDAGPDSAHGTNSALVAVNEGGDRTPLFAGGSHPRYAEVARRLGPDQPFYRMDVYSLMALDAQRDAPRHIESMAAYFVDAIRAIQPRGPYRIGGGCEGAMVAFEVALRLQAAGDEVESLTLWITPGPGNSAGEGVQDSPLRRVATQVQSLVRHGMGQRLGLGGWGQLLRHEVAEYRIFDAVHRYRPAARFQGDLVLLRTYGDDPRFLQDMTMGWSEHVTGEVQVEVLDGDHDTWLDRSMERFSQRLQSRLSVIPS